MKGYFAMAACAAFIVFAIAAPAGDDETPTAATSEPKKCREFCPMDYSPVCGYDGVCYKEYPNKCAYDVAKCSRKSNLETVDTSLCELANKDNHPNYKTCSD